ncbi:MAG: nucleotidyltransferase family protein [Actinomycetota bacterium]|nr:nucleotidyltransferase family protein [Actinomycetota bacterium]
MAGTQAVDLPVLLAERRDAIWEVVTGCRGRRVRVFGSVARGDDRPDSDIDSLVDFEAGSSLFDLVHLTGKLEELFERPVDVVSTGGLKERDRHILDEAIDL